MQFVPLCDREMELIIQLDLKQVILHPGGSMPFSFELDLSDRVFYGASPFAQPVRVSGQVRSHADLLIMSGQAETTLHVNCDRCGKPFLRDVVYPFEHMLADHLEDEENDEILLMNGSALDPSDAFSDVVICSMDRSNLCHEDCRGRCFHCGKDLNEGPCACKPEIDPRMAVLAKLLERED